MLIILFYLFNFNCNQFKYDFDYNSDRSVFSISCLELHSVETKDKEQSKIIFKNNVQIEQIPDPSNIDPTLIKYTIFFTQNYENGKGKIGRVFLKNILHIVKYDNEGKKLERIKYKENENINNNNFLEYQAKDDEIEEIETITQHHSNSRTKFSIVSQGNINNEREYDEEERLNRIIEYDEQKEIKKIKQYEYDDNGTLRYTQVRDKNNILLQEKFYNEVGKVFRFKIYIFEQGKLTQTQQQYYDDNEIIIYLNTQFNDGILLEQFYNREKELIERIEYDKEGKLLKTTEFEYVNGKLKQKNIKDKRGNLLKKKQYLNEQRIKITTYYYDEKGEVEKIKEEYSCNNVIDIVFIKDKFFNTLEETFYDQNGEKTQSTLYVYGDNGEIKIVEITIYIGE